MPKFLIAMPPMHKADVKRTWAKVFKARRTAGDESLRMDRAYMDAETGKVICCWEADSRQQVADLFKRADVVFESITQVDEMLAKEFA